ncbi:MAG: hypothetical protein HY804_06515 [Nitrospinae bacterium]|nr:hypothetical protein [Nitrospinota bacterium]
MNNLKQKKHLKKVKKLNIVNIVENVKKTGGAQAQGFQVVACGGGSPPGVFRAKIRGQAATGKRSNLSLAGVL